MRKLAKILLISVLLISVIFSASSCALIEKYFNTGDKSVPAHECEQYSVWKIEKYSTESREGTKRLVCDYCGKKSDKASISKVSRGLSYEIKDDGAWVTGIGDCSDTELVIPEKIDGREVVGIADMAFKENTQIVSVIMPDAVKTVGYGAFSGASSLSSVILSSELEILGELAFRNCALTSVYIPGSIGNNFGYGAFSFCTPIKNVVLGEGVEFVQSNAFHSCENLEFISLPSTLKEISNAFYGAENLKTVNFRGHIGQFCELETTPNSLGGTQSYVTFYSATILVGGEPIPENVVIPDGTTKITSRKFWCMDIKSVKIPDSVTTIGNEAFAHCSKLEGVEFGKGIKSIGSYAFRGCEKIEKIIIHDGIETIGHGAFQECKGLKSVEIGEGLEVLEASTLEGLASLEALKLPSTLTSYKYPIFLFNTKLQNVYYGGTVEQWFAFMESSGYSCDDFDKVRVHCADGEIYDNEVVE